MQHHHQGEEDPGETFPCFIEPFFKCLLESHSRHVTLCIEGACDMNGAGGVTLTTLASLCYRDIEYFPCIFLFSVLEITTWLNHA